MTEEFKIVEYDQFAASIEELRDISNFIPDVTTKEGYDKSKRVALDVGKILTKLEKTRKDRKKYFLDGGREVDAQAKKIASILEEIQKPHKDAYKRLDEKKKAREDERKAKLEERIEYMSALPDAMQDSSSGEIAGALEMLNSEECLDFFEYTQRALEVRNESRKLMAALLDKTINAEREKAELERLRKEADERARAEREEKIKREAAAKAEAEKLAAEEAARKAKEAELAAKKAAIEAEERRKREAEEAEARRIEQEKKAKIAAEQAAEKARLAEVARQEDEARREAEELAKREANKKHIGKIRKEAKDALMEQGLTEWQAKNIVLAIHNNLIPNIKINY